MRRLSNTALLIPFLLFALTTTAAAEPLPGMNEALDGREYVFGCAAGALPGHPGFLPGANALSAAYDEDSRLGLAYGACDVQEPAAGGQQLTYVSPVSDSLRLGTLAVELRRRDSGFLEGADGDYRDVGFALGFGWAVGLGTEVILPEGDAASAEDLIQRALEEETDDGGEIEEYVEEDDEDTGNGDDIEDYEENPADWVSQAPEYRPGYYLGFDFRVFSRELIDDIGGQLAGDQGFSLDISAAVPLVWQRLYLSIGLQNLFQANIELAGVKELAPRRITGALGFTWEGLTLAAGLESDLDGNLAYCGAAEYLLLGVVALRAGYHGTAPAAADSTAEVRAGLGLRIGGFELDLAAGLPLDKDEDRITLAASVGVVL